jgi:hypothetical protein
MKTQWSTKNETCGIFFNDVPMEEMFENYPSLETKNNRIPENEEEKWKWTIKSYMLK